jgi:sugar phosphate isomerase/epimerase
MKLGINSYTYMWAIGFKGVNPDFPHSEARPSRPLSAIGLLQKAKELGVELVQTGPNLPLDQLPDEELNKFIETARAWGIELELGTRGLDTKHLVRQVELAKRMGAKLIRTLPEIDGKYVASSKLIIPMVKEIVPLLEREDIKLAIENGRIPAAELRAALDAVGSRNVGVVLDMVNSLAVPEGWKEVSRSLAPYTMNVHYKDFIIKRAWHMMGFICEGTPAGRGMVEIDWLLEMLKVSPYDFNVIVELWTPEQTTFDQTVALEQAWAVESVFYLRQYMRQYIPN